MKHREIGVGVLIGVGIGILISFALHVEAKPIVYEAEQEEPKEVLIQIETEEQKIERLVREEFVDAPIMVKVARCESQFKNVPGKSSNDFGPFQVNYVHLKTLAAMGLDREKVEDNIKYARYLYNKNGLKDWENSKKCWNK